MVISAWRTYKDGNCSAPASSTNKWQRGANTSPAPITFHGFVQFQLRPTFLQYSKVARCTKSKASEIWLKEESEHHAGKMSPTQRLGYQSLERPQCGWSGDTSEPIRFCRRWTAAMWLDKAVSVWSDRLRSVGPAQCKMPVDHSIGPWVCKMC